MITDFVPKKILSDVPDKERGIGKCVAFARNIVNIRMLTEKQLSKLRDKHRMADHLLYWCIDTLSKTDITNTEYTLLSKISAMGLPEQMKTYIVDNRLVEVPKNAKTFRIVKANKKQGGYTWRTVTCVKHTRKSPFDDK